MIWKKLSRQYVCCALEDHCAHDILLMNGIVRDEEHRDKILMVSTTMLYIQILMTSAICLQ